VRPKCSNSWQELPATWECGPERYRGPAGSSLQDADINFRPRAGCGACARTMEPFHDQDRPEPVATGWQQRLPDRRIDSSDQNGVSDSATGDIDGDGIDDLVKGAFLSDPNGACEADESCVIFVRAIFTPLSTWRPSRSASPASTTRRY
jgi:hypothetical protein